MGLSVPTRANTSPKEELWIAMSALWLDNEVNDAALKQIACVVAKSGLSRTELDKVFELELAPSLGANHLSAAGEWTSFDPTWVCEQAQGYENGYRLFPRILAFLGITTYAARPYWNRVKELAFDSTEHSP
jgi:hypothetical protein